MSSMNLRIGLLFFDRHFNRFSQPQILFSSHHQKNDFDWDLFFRNSKQGMIFCMAKSSLNHEEN